jgi:hypothetical protein
VVLVGVAGDERVHRDGVVADLEAAGGLQLALARQDHLDHVGAVAYRHEAVVTKHLLDDGKGVTHRLASRALHRSAAAAR